MPGNTFGKLFKITTFGESHGKALGVIIDGCLPNIEISLDKIQKELDRRKPGQSKITTSRKENDEFEILSGIFEGKTTGTPIAIIIKNKDQKSADYNNLKDIFRPGHADYSYIIKYGIRDYRGGGRASGRETVARVLAGAIAKQILEPAGISIKAYSKEIAGIKAKNFDITEIENNIVRTPDAKIAPKMIKAIEMASKKGDSVGGIIECVVSNVFPGLGEPVFEKLDAQLAQAMLSIGAVKGIEFGAGFEASRMKGSEHNDDMIGENQTLKFNSNNNGGIIGGISNGADIIFRLAIKPTPSISKKQNTVDMDLQEHNLEIKGRHDACICPRVVPVVEAMTAITLVNAIFEQKAILQL